MEVTENTLTSSTLVSKQILDVAVQEFVDTPVEENILKFKNLLMSKFQVFNDWFHLQSEKIKYTGEKSYPNEATCTCKY